MAFIHDNAHDALLNYIKNNATVLHICSTEPTQYSEVATYTLGNKSTPGFTGPAAGDASGRKITVTAISDGSVTADGTAAFWAIVSGTELLAANDLAATQGVSNGNTFTLPAFDIENPDPT